MKPRKPRALRRLSRPLSNAELDLAMGVDAISTDDLAKIIVQAKEANRRDSPLERAAMRLWRVWCKSPDVGYADAHSALMLACARHAKRKEKGRKRG